MKQKNREGHEVGDGDRDTKRDIETQGPREAEAESEPERERKQTNGHREPEILREGDRRGGKRQRQVGGKNRDRGRQMETERWTQRLPEQGRLREEVLRTGRRGAETGARPQRRRVAGVPGAALRVPSGSVFSERHPCGVWVRPGVSVTLLLCLTLRGNPTCATEPGAGAGCVFVTGRVCVCGLVSLGVSVWAVLVCCQACLCVSHFPIAGGSMFLHDM